MRGEVRGGFVPVLLLTALSEIEYRLEGFELGANDYVTKPFNVRELQARVNSLFRIRGANEISVQENC